MTARERLRRVYRTVLAELDSGDIRRRQRALLWLASAEPCVEIMLWPRDQDGGCGVTTMYMCWCGEFTVIDGLKEPPHGWFHSKQLKISACPLHADELRREDDVAVEAALARGGAA